MRRAIAVLAGLLLSGSAIAQTTPNWALHYVPPPAEWNGLWASKQDYNAPGVFTTLTASGNANITGNLTVTGTITGLGGSFLPIKGGTLTTGGSVLTFTPGATTSIAPIISVGGTAGLQLSAGTAGVSIVGGGPLTANNGVAITRAIAPAGVALNPLNTWTANLSGSTTTANPSIYQYNGSDSLAIPSGFVNYWTMNYSFGGSTMIGNRKALHIVSSQFSKSGNFAAGFQSPGGPFYQAALFTQQINATEGGTTTNQNTSYGQAFAGSSTIKSVPGATFFHGLSNWEFDMAVSEASYAKGGISIVQLSTDTAQGVLDGAIGIINGGNSANNGWHNGIVAIGPNGNFPYAADGWLFNAPLAQDWATFNTMRGGINLEPIFTQAAILSRNFSIDGLGTVQVGNGYLAKTAGGVSLDASGSVGPAEGAVLSGAAIVSGGTGYTGGLALHDPYGGSWSVTTAPGGVIASITCIRTPYFNSSTPPANPVTLTPPLSVLGIVGGTVTVTMPWTQPNTVAISPAGGPTTVGGSLAVTGTITGPTTTQAVDTNTTALASTAFVLAQAAAATPLIDGTATVGTSTRYARADHIHPTDTTRAALTGATFTGTVNIGTNATTQVLTINGPAGVGRVIQWNTANSKRWQWNANATAEGGANAGTDFVLTAYDDTGTLLFTPLTITRSTGVMNFATALKFSGSNIVANGVIATTVTSLGPTGSHTTIQEWLTVQNGSGTTRYIPLY